MKDSVIGILIFVGLIFADFFYKFYTEHRVLAYGGYATKFSMDDLCGLNREDKNFVLPYIYAEAAKEILKLFKEDIARSILQKENVKFYYKMSKLGHTEFTVLFLYDFLLKHREKHDLLFRDETGFNDKRYEYDEHTQGDNLNHIGKTYESMYFIVCSYLLKQPEKFFRISGIGPDTFEREMKNCHILY